MGFIDRWLFGDIFSAPNDRENKPPVYGGDAVLPEAAATVNESKGSE